MAESLQIAECQNFGLATIMMRRGGSRDVIAGALQMNVPDGPTCTRGNALTLVGVGPATWLAFTPDFAGTWATDLAAQIPDVSISDQSGGYVILKISGPAARLLLQRGAFIDLDPSTFNVGSAAVTVIAHIGVVIWQIDDASTFYVALFRSFAESFREWIDVASHSLKA